MNTLNVSTATVALNEPGLIYQPHRLQRSGCARALEATVIEHLVDSETLGERYYVPIVNTDDVLTLEIVDI